MAITLIIWELFWLTGFSFHTFDTIDVGRTIFALISVVWAVTFLVILKTIINKYPIKCVCYQSKSLGVYVHRLACIRIIRSMHLYTSLLSLGVPLSLQRVDSVKKKRLDKRMYCIKSIRWMNCFLYSMGSLTHWVSQVNKSLDSPLSRPLEPI